VHHTTALTYGTPDRLLHRSLRDLRLARHSGGPTTNRRIQSFRDRHCAHDQVIGAAYHRAIAIVSGRKKLEREYHFQAQDVSNVIVNSSATSFMTKVIVQQE
jgi:hypothetical protein